MIDIERFAVRLLNLIMLLFSPIPGWTDYRVPVSRPSQSGSLDHFLGQVGVPMFFAELRTLPHDGPAYRERQVATGQRGELVFRLDAAGRQLGKGLTWRHRESARSAGSGAQRDSWGPCSLPIQLKWQAV